MTEAKNQTRLGAPDFLPTITIKATDFANEITHFNIKRGIQPEALPATEDLKKVQRRGCPR